MKIRIQVRHDAASERIQRYVTAEFERIAQKFDVISAEFILDQEGSNGHLKVFEAIVRVPGDTITVKESDTEAHKAIDLSMKVLEKQLKKHKETYLRPGAMIRHNIERSQPNL